MGGASQFTKIDGCPGPLVLKLFLLELQMRLGMLVI